MKNALELKIGVQLSMTPQLQQAIRLLQMSSIEILAEIQTFVETNPLVEVEETETTDNTLTAESDDEDSDRSLQDEMNWGSPRQEQTINSIETLNGNKLSLRDHLFWQMQLTPFSTTDRLIASAIIDAISEDGFLTCSLEDIHLTLTPAVETDLANIEAVLHRIQQFDPVGVGSRNLEECLKIQINHLPPTTPWHHQAQMLITHYLLLLGKHDYLTLRRRLGLRSDELSEVIRLVQTLNPRPGTKISDKNPEYIIPDAYTFRFQGKWIVELNAQFTPKLSINEYYASIINQKNNRSHQPALKQQLQEAKWFLKSIEARNSTLKRVIEAIVSRQADYLEWGDEYMKPLILQDIASELNMHESTISRITTQKYLHTPRGVIELKYFFSTQLKEQSSFHCSTTAVKALIKKMIAAENSKKPLSDSTISSNLAAQGISIARRTVAKYREDLKILPSHERKKL